MFFIHEFNSYILNAVITLIFVLLLHHVTLVVAFCYFFIQIYEILSRVLYNKFGLL